MFLLSLLLFVCNVQSMPVNNCLPPSTIPLGNNCNVTATACKLDNLYYGFATSDGMNYSTNANITDPNLAISIAVVRLVDVLPCACAGFLAPEGASCYLELEYCTYFETDDALLKPNVPVAIRSKVTDLNNSAYVGFSPGFYNKTQGAPATSDGVFKSFREATDDLKTKFPQTVRPCGTSPPMIIVPGFSGTLLEYKLDDAAPIPLEPFCERNTNGQWKTLYPFPPNLTVAETGCLLQNFKVGFDNTTQTFNSLRKGCSTRTGGTFGSFDGVAGLGPFAMEIFYPMGWNIGENLFAAPYDWRIPPFAQPTFFEDFQNLVEKAYTMNGNTKVVINAASGGPQYALAFLHRMTQEWKDKYIMLFSAISPVWGGVTAAMAAMVGGLSSTTPGIGPPQIADAIFVHAITKNNPAAIWYYPRMGTNSSNSWTAEETIIYTPNMNYTVADIQELFKNAGIEESQYNEYEYVYNDKDLKELAAPGVDTYVTYGFDVDTPYQYVYNKIFNKQKFIGPPEKTIMTSGDGLVPLKSSLRGLALWNSSAMNGHTLTYKGYSGQIHADCFSPFNSTECFADLMQHIRFTHQKYL
eukprot:m.272606 g.272606  ORF g.272606 m.272606 type:complete len:582 (+) comp16275_c2_seq1:118-1863(+)